MSKGTLNKAIIVGRLGHDPDLRYTPQGIPVSVLNVATDQAYRDQSGKWISQTDWHKVVLWRKLAELGGQRLKKGALVCVEGQLKTRSWDDKNGIKRYMTEIVADSMQLLNKRKAAEQEQVDEDSEEASEEVVEESTESLPF